MDVFRTMVDLSKLNKKEDMERAVSLILVNPVFQKDTDIAICILRIDPLQYFVFHESIHLNMQVAKLLVRRPTFNLPLNPIVTTRREFIDYVFREQPHYASQLPRGTAMLEAFTPELTEYVMQKVCRKVYSHRILKEVPVWVRRVYAHDKLRERDSFHRLLFESRTNIVTRLPRELKMHVADMLGLVKSNHWFSLLTLVKRQIY